MRKSDYRRLARTFLLELSVYAVLVVIYFWVVLRVLGGWLIGIFDADLRVYAVVALGLVVAQGALLDFVTTFLLDLLKVDRLD